MHVSSCVSSEFSEVVDLFTSCSVPLPPFPPELEKAGVTWLCLKWQRPTSSPKEDDIYYILEMEEEGLVGSIVFVENTLFYYYCNKPGLDPKRVLLATSPCVIDTLPADIKTRCPKLFVFGSFVF